MGPTRLFLSLVFTLLPLVFGLGQKQCITFERSANQITQNGLVIQQTLSTESQADHFVLFSTDDNVLTPLLLDSKDDSAIHIAAGSFADDIERVSGSRPVLYNDTLPKDAGDQAIIIGSLESDLIKSLKRDGQSIDGRLQGKWESFDVRTKSNPVKGVKQGLVITGSDRVRLSC